MGVLYCRAKGRTKKKRRGRKPPAFLWRLLIVGYVHLGYVYLFFMSIFLAELWSLQIHRVMATSTGENHLGAGAFHRGSGTLYDFLGISPRSSQAEIKRVFRRLAVRMHPDKIGPFESAAAERKANDLFVKILKAYETLGDPALRQKYDMGGMREDAAGSVVEEEPGPRYEDSPFGIFIRFGAGRGGMWFRYKGHGARHAPDIAIPLQLTFEEAFEGKTANVTVTRERLCSACGATGSAKPEEMPTCPLCVGKGYAYHLFGVHESRGSESEGHHHHHHHHTAHDQHPGDRCSRRIEDGTSGFWAGAGVTGTAEGGTPPVPGYTHAVNTTCKACGGMGKLSDGGCPDCHGKKVKMETETFEVSMPPGALPGHTVTLSGKGHEYPGKVSGSIRVVAVQLPHPRFERQGADLVYKARISLINALQGFERKLTLLNGTRVAVVHDEMSLSGFRRELPNLGFPVVGKDDERGALVVECEVDFPPRLKEEHLSILRGFLTEEEIAILEDVLKLMSSRQGQDREEMDPLEFHFSRCCRDDKPPTCVPDLLWWTRVIDFVPVESDQAAAYEHGAFNDTTSVFGDTTGQTFNGGSGTFTYTSQSYG